MTTALTPRDSERPPVLQTLRVTAYDRVASLLIALLILIGLVCAILFIIWLTTVLVFTQKSVPVQMIEYEGRGDHAEGFERDLEPPGLEELEEVQEPALEATLEAVTDVMSTQAAALDALDTDAKITGKGSGAGDSRRPGPLGEGRNVVPPWERWEIQYSTTSINVYARQLQGFGIELGAAGGSNTVDYATNLTKPRPDRRTGPADAEQRIYMTWRSGPLKAFDEQLLQRAGAQTAGRIVMQFYDEQLVRHMESLEFANAGESQPPETWLKTVFGVRPKGNGYEFYIIEQLFRPAPPT